MSEVQGEKGSGEVSVRRGEAKGSLGESLAGMRGEVSAVRERGEMSKVRERGEVSVGRERGGSSSTVSIGGGNRDEVSPVSQVSQARSGEGDILNQIKAAEEMNEVDQVSAGTGAIHFGEASDMGPTRQEIVQRILEELARFDSAGLSTHQRSSITADDSTAMTNESESGFPGESLESGQVSAGERYLQQKVFRADLLQQPQLLEYNKRVKRLLRGRIIQRYALAFGLHSLVGSAGGDEFVKETQEELEMEESRILEIESEQEEEKAKVKDELNELIEKITQVIQALKRDGDEVYQLGTGIRIDLDEFVLSNVDDEHLDDSAEVNAAKAKRNELQAMLNTLKQQNHELEWTKLPQATTKAEAAQSELRRTEASLSLLTAAVEASASSLLTHSGLNVEGPGGVSEVSEVSKMGGEGGADRRAHEVILGNEDKTMKAAEERLQKELGFHSCFTSIKCVEVPLCEVDDKRDAHKEHNLTHTNLTHTNLTHNNLTHNNLTHNNLTHPPTHNITLKTDQQTRRFHFTVKRVPRVARLANLNQTPTSQDNSLSPPTRRKSLNPNDSLTQPPNSSHPTHSVSHSLTDSLHVTVDTSTSPPSVTELTLPPSLSHLISLNEINRGLAHNVTDLTHLAHNVTHLTRPTHLNSGDERGGVKEVSGETGKTGDSSDATPLHPHQGSLMAAVTDTIAHTILQLTGTIPVSV